MSSRFLLLTFTLWLISLLQLGAQTTDSLYNFSGVVYDGSFRPVPATHVININTHQGNVTDSLGIFRLLVHSTDTLLIRNIAFRDTLVSVAMITIDRNIIIRRKFYQLLEARIFQWGSTYSDFKRAVIEMPAPETLGESLELPQQDPDYIPYDMDEQAIKSAGFLLTSPISYFYHNFNKQAKSARKVYWLKKDQEKHQLFNEIMSAENLTNITSLKGVELQKFQTFLSQKMRCDINCSELDIYSEIHSFWKIYQELQERDMLPPN